MVSERRGVALVVYLDLIFLINSLSDALALYITARLSGLPLRNSRLVLASLCGGVYGVLCYLPISVPLGSFLVQIFIAMLLVRLVFQKKTTFLRLFVLFFLLSCTLGGAMTVLSQQIYQYGMVDTLQQLDWKVFFIVTGLCYFLLSVVFRGSAKHAVAGEICRIAITRGEQTALVDALYDTGHTLCDPYSGTSIVTVWYPALDALWSDDERAILDQLGTRGSVWCAEQLGEIASGHFRLVPYRAVGVACAMLLTFPADEVCIDRMSHGKLTVALSPTPVSDGGGYTALWGGERNGTREDGTADKTLATSTTTAVGVTATR